MPQIELIYDHDCPNVATARQALSEALAIAGQTRTWTEWDRAAPEAPAYVRLYGSPTILIDGRDVAEAATTADSSACRIYPRSDGGFAGAPSADVIVSALRGTDLTVDTADNPDQ